MTNSDLKFSKKLFERTYPQADVVDTFSNEKTDSILDDPETYTVDWEGYAAILIEPHVAGTSYSRILIPFPEGGVLLHVPDSEVTYNA